MEDLEFAVAGAAIALVSAWLAYESWSDGVAYTVTSSVDRYWDCQPSEYTGGTYCVEATAENHSVKTTDQTIHTMTNGGESTTVSTKTDPVSGTSYMY
jgi:hypothetical protein